MNWDIVAFWIVLGAIALGVTWAGHLGRLESERTIRQAIDKGLPLDAALIDGLQRAGVLLWRQRLMLWGIVVGALGLGLLAFALVLAFYEPESTAPLAGIAAIFVFTGAGFAAAATWLAKDANLR